jgi:glutathione S-transferase
MVSTKPTLQYFDIAGRAEAIRVACYMAKVDYDDIRLTQEEFGAKKAAGEFPLGSVPVWTEDGEKFCGSNNILRMIGARNGMYCASNPETAWMIDSSMELIEDNMKNYAAYFFKIMGGGEPGEEEIQKQCNYWEAVCACIERRLAKHGKKYVAGTDMPTIADCKMIVNFYDSIYNPANPMMKQDVKDKMCAIVDKYPCTKKWSRETMMMHLKGYMARKEVIEVTFLGFGNGRADPIIQLLAHAGVNWKKNGLTPEEWGARKGAGETAEFGVMPIVKHGDTQYDLSLPALRRVAIKLGYYPMDDWKSAMRCDHVTEAYGDAFNALVGIIVGSETPEEKMKKMMPLFEEGATVCKFFKLVEKTLECSKGPFICGAKVSMADCCLTSFIFNHFKNVKGNPDLAGALGPVLASKFPGVEKYSLCLEKEFAGHLTTRTPTAF